jgi:hypothetical protein
MTISSLKYPTANERVLLHKFDKLLDAVHDACANPPKSWAYAFAPPFRQRRFINAKELAGAIGA